MSERPQRNPRDRKLFHFINRTLPVGAQFNKDNAPAKFRNGLVVFSLSIDEHVTLR
jgi:hypothetical protein